MPRSHNTFSIFSLVKDLSLVKRCSMRTVLCVCMYVRHACMHACMHTYIHTCIHTYMYVFMCVCVCMHILAPSYPSYVNQNKHTTYHIRISNQTCTAPHPCALFIWPKRPIHIWLKRPIYMAKEAYQHSYPIHAPYHMPLAPSMPDLTTSCAKPPNPKPQTLHPKPCQASQSPAQEQHQSANRQRSSGAHCTLAIRESSYPKPYPAPGRAAYAARACRRRSWSLRNAAVRARPSGGSSTSSHDRCRCSFGTSSAGYFRGWAWLWYWCCGCGASPLLHRMRKRTSGWYGFLHWLWDARSWVAVPSCIPGALPSSSRLFSCSHGWILACRRRLVRWGGFRRGLRFGNGVMLHLLRPRKREGVRTHYLELLCGKIAPSIHECASKYSIFRATVPGPAPSSTSTSPPYYPHATSVTFGRLSTLPYSSEHSLIYTHLWQQNMSHSFIWWLLQHCRASARCSWPFTLHTIV